MSTPTAKQMETEKQIRERLEETGEFAKMRAMIVDAALQSLARDQPAEAKEKLFYPSKALVEAKSTTEGKQALGAVYAYLNRLGLQYTASVLALETGVSAEELARSDGGNGSDLLSKITAAAPVSTTTTNTQPSVPVPVPVPIPSAGGGAAAAAVASSASSASSKDDVEDEDENDDNDDAAEEPVQPGAEDSTYFIAKWKKKTFVRMNQVVGQQLQVEYLTDCTVVVLDPLDSMTVDDCEGGQLIIAACEGSVFLRNCKNMTVHVACKQLRTRDCQNIELHIFTTTDPVVEMSHHMTFRPFHLRLPNLKKSFKEARLDPALNRFVHVYDFTVDEPSLPLPHFTVKYPDHGVVMENRCEDRGAAECPVEIEDLLSGKLLPAASSESGQNKSYDIKTGSAAWAAATATALQPTAKEEEAVEDKASEAEDEEESEVESVASDSDGETAGAAKPRTMPVPSAGGVRPPVAPVPTANASASLGGPKLGGLDDQEYSSFDESSGSDNGNDKYEVEEDDDDF